ATRQRTWSKDAQDAAGLGFDSESPGRGNRGGGPGPPSSSDLMAHDTWSERSLKRARWVALRASTHLSDPMWRKQGTLRPRYLPPFGQARSLQVSGTPGKHHVSIQGARDPA